MLKSAGIELPKTVFNHGFLTFNGQKISKSLGNAISPRILVDKYGADTVRYFALRQFPFASGEDGDFSESALVDRHNNELANKLGNLVMRVSTLAEKYGLEKTKIKDLPNAARWAIEKNWATLELDIAESRIEKDKSIGAANIGLHYTGKDEKGVNSKEYTLNQMSKAIFLFIKKDFEKFELDKAIDKIFRLIDCCNWCVQEKKPWETHDKKILYELANAIKDIAILLSPFMPSTSEKIASTFGFKISLDDLEKPLKVSKITKSEILFKKIENK